MTIDSGRGRPGPTWSHKLVSGRIPAIKRRLPEDDLRGAHPETLLRRQASNCYMNRIANEEVRRPCPPGKNPCCR